VQRRPFSWSCFSLRLTPGRGRPPGRSPYSGPPGAGSPLHARAGHVCARRSASSRTALVRSRPGRAHSAGAPAPRLAGPRAPRPTAGGPAPRRAGRPWSGSRGRAWPRAGRPSFRQTPRMSAPSRLAPWSCAPVRSSPTRHAPTALKAVRRKPVSAAPSGRRSSPSNFRRRAFLAAGLAPGLVGLGHLQEHRGAFDHGRGRLGQRALHRGPRAAVTFTPVRSAPAEVGPLQVRARHVRPFQQGPAEIGVLQIGAGELGVLQRTVREVRGEAETPASLEPSSVAPEKLAWSTCPARTSC